jgi:hypothetical protein
MREFFPRFSKASLKHHWLDYDICAEVEWLCDGKVVETMDSLRYLNWFNLIKMVEKVVPLDKRKVEYLVHTLANYIDIEKDIVKYADTSIYLRLSKLDEEARAVKLRSLNEERRATIMKETWEKQVIEQAGISYEDHRKHRDMCKQDYFREKYRRQSKKNAEFVKTLDEILKPYAKTAPQPYYGPRRT